MTLLKLRKLAIAMLLGFGCYGAPGKAQDLPLRPADFGTEWESTEARESNLAQALAVAQEIPQLEVKARVMGEIALQYVDIGQAETGAEILAQALAVGKSIPEDGLRAFALADLAGIHYIVIGEAKFAKELLDEAVEIAQGVEDDGERGRLLAAIGVKYADLGENDIAASLLSASEEAITLSQQPVPLFPFQEIPWTGTLTISANLASGANTTSLARLGFTTERKWPQDQIDLSFNISNNFDDSRPEGDRNRIKAELFTEFRHHYNARWQYFIRSRTLRDELNNIDIRSDLSFGPGINLWRRENSRTLDMHLGLAVRFEETSGDSGDSGDSVDGDLHFPLLEYGLQYKNILFGNWKLRQFLTFDMPVADSADYYLTSNTSLGIPLSKKWSFSNSLELRYTGLPTDDNPNLRVDFLTGLSYKF